MIKIVSKDQCCGCHACATVCPRSAITMNADREGFLYPKVDTDLCVECGLCERVCPLNQTVKSDEGKKPSAYAAKNKDESVRRVSSSGGVFTLLAERVLDAGGVVFGAAFDGARRVRHIAVEKKEDLALLRGSKYLQSRIGDCYRRAREYLNAGRTVLFSGTPCQIGGLRSYLGKDFENLICQDIICHGVPASVTWERALIEYEKAFGAAVTDVSFRSKSSGWHGYSLSLTLADGRVEEISHGDVPYMTAFIGDLCLRPSCYACGFKGLSRVSDLTLADFWGIENVLPHMDDNKGTSLVFVHSERGAALLREISQKVELEAVDAADAVRHNPSMLHSARDGGEREAFMRDAETMPLLRAVRRHTKKTPVERLKMLLRKILRRV